MLDWRAAVRARVATERLHPQDEAELVEEIGQHLELNFTELASRIGEAEARDQLMAQLHDSTFEEAISRRRQRAIPSRARTWSSTSLFRDIQHGLRSLRRSPGTLAAGTIALGLGIGLTTMMYSIIYGSLIKGLPFRDGSRIAYVSHTDIKHHNLDAGIVLADFERYAARQRSFETLGGLTRGTATVTGGDRPDRVGTSRVTAGVFAVLGVRPLLGRTFVASDNESNAPPTALLSHGLWRDLYSSDSAAVGRTISVDGNPYAIIGVMPEGFEFPERVRIWLALDRRGGVLPVGEGPSLNVIGRLRPGVDFSRANADLENLSRQIASERPAGAPELRAAVQPYIHGTMPRRVWSLLYGMQVAVMLVLLIACANVTNLLLDRTLGRSREIGIRTALGASRLAVIRQSIVESSILAFLAALLGTGLAQIGIVAFNSAFPAAERRLWMEFSINPAVLLFVLAMAVLATIVSGLLPALQSARLDGAAILKDESHSASSLRVGRMSRVIVGVQIALSSALLLAAGFITKSIAGLRTVDPGFATDGVYTARVTASSSDTAKRRVFFESVEQQLSSLPGVQGVYIGNDVPGSGWSGTRFEVEGLRYTREEDYPFTLSLAVGPGFFSTFDVRTIRGRPIAIEDRGGAPLVAVVSEAFVRRFFKPTTDPIGHRVRLGGPGTERGWTTIVGVIPTLYSSNLENPWQPEVLTSYRQERPSGTVSVAIRGNPDIANVATIRNAVSSIDANVPVYAAASMREAVLRPMGPMQLLGTVFATFGVVALMLAAIGLYAVMAFTVHRRVREVGIRMALGARTADVIRLIAGQGARQTLIGMTIGFLLGGAFVRLIRSMLFGVQPSDPVVFGLVAGVLGGSALVACLIPALRATRVDPVVALRSE
jgi:predicted permease